MYSLRSILPLDYLVVLECLEKKKKWVGLAAVLFHLLSAQSWSDWTFFG